MSFHELIRPGPGLSGLLPGSCFSVLTLLACAFATTSMRAESPRPEVEVELILAVDVSASMSAAEQQVQRDGYVNAFRHPDVALAIRSGQQGSIAVSYLE